MTKDKIAFYGSALLIVAEVCLIVYVNYAFGLFLPEELARYISLDVLFTLPIVQTAHLTAIRSSRRSDPQIATFVAISLALVWCATEMTIAWPDYPIIAFVLNTFTRSIVFIVIGRVLIKLWREREYSRIDVLTGLANRREFMERLSAEQGRSKRSGKPYSLLFIDIDNFKLINDLHGHNVGDKVLMNLSEILRLCSRKVDAVGRLGGDEFVLLLPETDESSCGIVIERIKSFTKQVFEKESWPISISIGQTTQTGNATNPDLVIEMADRDMYEFKRKHKHQMAQATN
jgi:diguanylate cyclase (GGDEF)-like protein